MLSQNVKFLFFLVTGAGGEVGVKSMCVIIAPLPEMPHTEGLVVHVTLEASVTAKLLTGYLAVFNISFPFASLQDTVALESMPLLGFTIAPEKEEGSSEVGPIFHLYHKKTVFYSFKAEDTNSAQRYQNN